jgi:hypothetical protein
VLSHAEEWQPGPGGAVVPYPGFGPVGGLANQVWCGTCRAVRLYVFVRLDPPGDHPVIAYAEAQRLGRTGDETGPCPACGDPLTWEMEGVVCPACEGGRFRETGAWEAGT